MALYFVIHFIKEKNYAYFVVWKNSWTNKTKRNNSKLWIICVIYAPHESFIQFDNIYVITVTFFTIIYVFLCYFAPRNQSTLIIKIELINSFQFFYVLWRIISKMHENSSGQRESFFLLICKAAILSFLSSISFACWASCMDFM